MVFKRLDGVAACLSLFVRRENPLMLYAVMKGIKFDCSRLTRTIYFAACVEVYQNNAEYGGRKMKSAK